MRILIFSDVHWCTYSSVIRKRGEYFSLRLENLIDSLNWVYELSKSKNCDKIVCLGDFFDKSELKSEEITALGELNMLPTVFLVGNHEMGINDLSFSSAELFSINNVSNIIKSKIDSEVVDNGETELVYLPYQLDTAVSLADILPERSTTRRIIFSHNDLKNIQLGPFLSKEGFELADIEANCDLFLNGHLHNGLKISDKIYNVGNLSGLNFSEDASKYKHGVYILDSQSLDLEFIENPFAFNFYKIDNVSPTNYATKLGNIKLNAILALTANRKEITALRECIDNDSRVLLYRIIASADEKAQEDIEIEEFEVVDHLKQFYDYILENVGTSSLIQSELEQIIK